MASISGSREHGLAHPHDHDHHNVSYLHPKGGVFVTIWDWMSTIDHKKIGVMYLVAILFMFFLGGMAALVVRLELMQPTAISIEAAKQVPHGQALASLFGE